MEREYLGVTLQELDEDTAKSFKLRDELTGVLISEVVEGSVAEKSGLKVGDIIMAVNDVTINNLAQLANIIGETGCWH